MEVQALVVVDSPAEGHAQMAGGAGGWCGCVCVCVLGGGGLYVWSDLLPPPSLHGKKQEMVEQEA